MNTASDILDNTDVSNTDTESLEIVDIMGSKGKPEQDNGEASAFLEDVLGYHELIGSHILADVALVVNQIKIKSEEFSTPNADLDNTDVIASDILDNTTILNIPEASREKVILGD